MNKKEHSELMKEQFNALADAFETAAYAFAGLKKLLDDLPPEMTVSEARAHVAKPQPDAAQAVNVARPQPDAPPPMPDEMPNITADSLRDHFVVLAEAGKREQCLEILNNFGVTRLQDLPPEMYAQCAALLTVLSSE